MDDDMNEAERDEMLQSISDQSQENWDYWNLPTENGGKSRAWYFDQMVRHWKFGMFTAKAIMWVSAAIITLSGAIATLWKG